MKLLRLVRDSHSGQAFKPGTIVRKIREIKQSFDLDKVLYLVEVDNIKFYVLPEEVEEEFIQ